MKRVNYTTFLFILVASMSYTNCTKDNDGFYLSNYRCTKLDTLVFTHSIKGWELYSWPVNSSWKYSFMIGTNATKTLSQVSGNPISVTGGDSLKVILSKLPEGEEISWLGQSWLENIWRSNYENLMLPPRSIQVDIKEFCDSRNLKLTIME